MNSEATPAYQVFLSHTSELANYVKAAKKAVELGNQHFICIDMATFAIEGRKTKDICRQRLEPAHIYVGIIGYHFGTAVESERPRLISYTQMEWEIAGALGIPRFMFLVTPGRASPQFYRSPRETEEEYQSQQDFRKSLEGGDEDRKIVRSPTDLTTNLQQALSTWLERQQADAQRKSELPPAPIEPTTGKKVAKARTSASSRSRYQSPAIYELEERLLVVEPQPGSIASREYPSGMQMIHSAPFDGKVDQLVASQDGAVIAGVIDASLCIITTFGDLDFAVWPRRFRLSEGARILCVRRHHQTVEVFIADGAQVSSLKVDRGGRTKVTPLPIYDLCAAVSIRNGLATVDDRGSLNIPDSSWLSSRNSARWTGIDAFCGEANFVLAASCSEHGQNLLYVARRMDDVTEIRVTATDALADAAIVARSTVSRELPRHAGVICGEDVSLWSWDDLTPTEDSLGVN